MRFIMMLLRIEFRRKKKIFYKNFTTQKLPIKYFYNNLQVQSVSKKEEFMKRFRSQEQTFDEFDGLSEIPSQKRKKLNSPEKKSDSNPDLDLKKQPSQNDLSPISNNPYSFMQQKKTSVDKFQRIRTYVIEHGFGEKTPPLTESLSADIFRQHYYDKKILMDFCRKIGITTTGLKKDLNNRIDTYLRTKEIIKVAPAKPKGKPDSELGIKLDTKVQNYKSDPATREFFKKHIPNFSFSAGIQKWIRGKLEDGEEFTYQDIVDEHKSFLKNKNLKKAAGEVIKVAHDSCELNQFSIDYSRDPQKKPHQLNEAWALVRDSAGDKTYSRYVQKIQEISEALDAEEKISNKIKTS